VLHETFVCVFVFAFACACACVCGGGGGLGEEKEQLLESFPQVFLSNVPHISQFPCQLLNLTNASLFDTSLISIIVVQLFEQNPVQKLKDVH
jgi:hypothetical protein